MFVSARKLHRYLGILLLLPILVWAATAVVFLLKPGYKAAFSTLEVRSHTQASAASIRLPAGGQQYRYLNTVLGPHLLVLRNGVWQHLDGETLAPMLVTPAQIKQLLDDAIAINRPRYGSIVQLDGFSATTSSGCELTLNWASLHIRQSCADTRRINQLYQLHYLQWSGNAMLDRFLGGLAIVVLFGLSLLGMRLLFRASDT